LICKIPPDLPFPKGGIMPLFGKEGIGEILWRIVYSKIPLNPPLLKGDDTKKDSV